MKNKVLLSDFSSEFSLTLVSCGKQSLRMCQVIQGEEILVNDDSQVKLLPKYATRYHLISLVYYDTVAQNYIRFSLTSVVRAILLYCSNNLGTSLHLSSSSDTIKNGNSSSTCLFSANLLLKFVCALGEAGG